MLLLTREALTEQQFLIIQNAVRNKWFLVKRELIVSYSTDYPEGQPPQDNHLA